MKKWDVCIIALAIVLSLLPLLAFGRGRQSGSVQIYQNGSLLYEGSLSQPATVTTPDGGNTVVIENGEARMGDADCPDGLCLAQGAASVQKPLVCLPNGVLVVITEEKEAPLDGITH